jgi:hypothetical protein
MRYLKHLAFFIALFAGAFSAYAVLPAITGPSSVCVSNNIAMSNTTGGGVWTSSNTAIATVVGSSGTATVTGVAAGIADITYAVGPDFSFVTVTVNPLPTAIAGPLSICSTVTLSSTPAGGTWSSATPAVAVASLGGAITPISTGTTTIYYTLPTGCSATAIVTVSAVTAISGPSTVCISTPATFIGTPSGGTWSISGGASVTTGGIVTGSTLGAASLTYVGGGCTATKALTVNPAIGAISGPSTLCKPATVTLTNSMSGGVWSSGVPGVATVNPTTGVVVAVGSSFGAVPISYSLGGCANVHTVSINQAPASIVGTASLCAGTTTTLAPTFGWAGSWISTVTSVATVGTAGDVFGLSAGNAGITFTNACGSASRIVTVTSSCSGTPTAGIITASASVVCSGTPVTLNLPAYTPVCGHIRQWQYSPDGFTWFDLVGANTVPYTFSPTSANYYRCRITCSSSGLSGFSGPIHVGVNFAIGSHSVIDAPSTTCLPSHFYVAACGVSSFFSVITSFGDGDSDTTALSTTTLSDAHIYHTYTLPGTYSVRHILLNGATPVDTVMFSYVYNYCRIFPIGFYKDINSNCSYDGGDLISMMPATVRVDSNGVPVDTLTTTSGLYYKPLGGPGTIYAFRPLSVVGGSTFTCPASGVIYDTVTTLTNTYPIKYFGLSCAAGGYDVEVHATSRLGSHTQRTTITVHNTFCTPVTPIVKMEHSGKYGFDPAVYPCSATSHPVASYSATSITWNMPTLAPNSVATIVVYLERFASIGSALFPGDTANYTISVSPTIGDINPSNNVIVMHDTVRSGFDPNDMAVAPGGYVLPCTELEYRVRFENTGNDTAHNIYVLDTLPAGLNVSTLYPVIASHAMNITVINSGGYNIAKFDFPNINLLDSSHHDKCTGMFIFRVKAHIAAVDGTVMTNRAGIYFDDNPVVMTNDVTNIIGIAPIEGPDHICLGYPDTLFNSTQGGLWASSTPAAGTISTVGIVTGIAAGTSTISYTVSNICTSRTATKTVTVSPIALPTVTIVTTDDTVCSGSPVIFNTTTTDAGTAPAFNWIVNGLVVGAGSAYSYMPLTGDVVKVSMTSSQACTLPPVVSDSLTMTVLPTGTPVAMISVSPNDTSCAGSPVTFTATPLMGGDAPVFKWFVNGVLSGTAPTLLYVPANGDAVYCRMGSNYHCRLADTVNSVVVNQTVDPMYIPVISISASPSLTVNAGDPITFTANVLGAGPSPVFEWYVNSLPVPGVTTATFTTTTLADYDSVTCRVTGSGICSITSFNSVYVTILPAGVTSIGADAHVSVFPNPNSGSFNIRADFGATTHDGEVSVMITNVLGQSIYRNVAATHNGRLDEAVQLPSSLANGVYTLILRKGESSVVYRMVIER